MSIRRPGVLDWARRRLAELAARMGRREYLVETFSAADILMSSVLRILHQSALLDEQPSLAAYRERCEARPAFQTALGGQMAGFGK